MTITVRQMTPADLETAGLIAMAAYGHPRSSEQILRRYLKMQSGGWYLAALDGEPAGLGGVMDFGAFATLGMMSVVPAMQKRGIGQALMEQLLSCLDERGCPTILLNARPRAISLYERYGFVPLEETRQFTFAPRALETNLLPGVSRLSKEELSTVAAFDAPAFGASRLAVLSAYFERDPQRFFVSRDVAGHLTGLLVAAEGSVGPWHAASAGAADLLLRQALRLPYAGSFLVSVLEHNLDAQALFAQHGGTAFATLAHMRRGQPLQRDPQQHLYGMASLLLC